MPIILMILIDVIMSMIDDYHDSDDDQKGLDHKEDIYEDCDNWVVWGKYLWQLWLWQLGGLRKIFMTINDDQNGLDHKRKIFMTITQTRTISRPSSCRENLFTFCSNRSCFSPPKVVLLFLPQENFATFLFGPTI